MLQVTVGSLSACLLLSLVIEGVGGELVRAPCLRCPPGRMARDCTRGLTLIRVMHCVVKSCLQAPKAQTRHRGKRERLLAHTWRMRQESSIKRQVSDVKRDVSRRSSGKSESLPIVGTNQRFPMVSVPDAIGNAVAQTESWKLQCFEISSFSRSKFDVHLTSVCWIRAARTETGAAKDQYR